MLKVQGIFDGTNIVLLEPVDLPPNTVVEVTIHEDTTTQEEFWQRLRDLGLITAQVSQHAPLPPFSPIVMTGQPVSETIIEERS